MKNIFILIGPKGSGKSYVGRLLEKELSIPFLRVEPLFLRINRGRSVLDPEYAREGYAEVRKEVGHILRREKSVIFETTGVSAQFTVLLADLRSEYTVKLIRIDAPEDLCRLRVKTRNPDGHLTVSDAQLERINRISFAQQYPYDGTIHNSGKSDRAIIDDFIRTVNQR
jgi:shikimate kinase